MPGPYRATKKDIRQLRADVLFALLYIPFMG